MKFSRLRLIFLSLLVASCVSAQGFFQTYAPASSTARDVVHTSDGGYLMVGSVADDSTLFLQKVDQLGQIVWVNHQPFNRSRAIAVSATPDGGFAVLTEFCQDGAEWKNAVLKLTGAGTFEWTRTLDNHYFFANGLRDIATTADGSLLLVGDTRNADYDLVNRVLKLDATGAVVWDKTFGSDFLNTTQMVQLSDGHYAVGGGRNNGDFKLAKINANGDLIWEKSYPKAAVQKGVSLIETIDGGIALLGTSQNPVEGRLEVMLLKTDNAGNELWANQIYAYPWPTSVPALFTLSGLAQDDAGNYYLPLSEPVELLKLDPSGNPLWKKDLQISGYAWSFQRTGGNYFVVAGDNNANALLTKIDEEGEFLNNKITGTVFKDLNADCLMNSGETGVANFIVEAKDASSGLTFYRNVNADGSYQMRVSPGQYAIVAKPAFGPQGFYSVCDTLQVTVTGPSETIDNQMIGIDPLAYCPMMEVEITGGLLRRCTTTQYTLNYCNFGNLPAENVSVEVTADTLLNYFSSTLPLTAQNGNLYSFNLPNVAPGECGVLKIQFVVDCDADLGEIICVEAHIFPDTSCVPPNSAWDGSQVEVSGQCDGNAITFNIKNTGSAPMTQALDYVIIEDHIMYMQGPILLDVGQDTTIEISNPAGDGYAGQLIQNGNTSTFIRIPTAAVENCITGGNSTLPLELNTGVNSPAFSTTCGEVIGSFDPNDKYGFPAGWGDDHLLERNQDIDYRIRFQNTGNDTAFLVVIRDTLPLAVLDPASVLPLGASHAYQWELNDRGVVTFTFPNILLPDSTTNEPASHGFVSFRIRQQPNLPDGARIENSAAIYFDFNDPVITNTYFHTIGRPQFTATKTPGSPDLLDFKVIPNPFAGDALFSLEPYMPQKDVQFRLFNSQGMPVRESTFSGNQFHFYADGLGAGLYFFTMKENGRLLTSGKVMVETIR